MTTTTSIITASAFADSQYQCANDAFAALRKRIDEDGEWLLIAVHDTGARRFIAEDDADGEYLVDLDERKIWRIAGEDQEQLLISDRANGILPGRF